jgi:hypothetical protein
MSGPKRQKIQTRAREDVVDRIKRYMDDNDFEATAHAVEQLLDDGLRANGYENGREDDVPTGAKLTKEIGKVALYLAGATYGVVLLGQRASPDLYLIAAFALALGVVAMSVSTLWSGAGVTVFGRTLFERDQA